MPHQTGSALSRTAPDFGGNKLFVTSAFGRFYETQSISNKAARL
jgi:hypothetical protein